MRKLIEYYDPIAEEWIEGYFIGYTSRDNTVVELAGGGVVVLLNGTAQLRDIGVE
jgi:hypothetical protein